MIWMPIDIVVESDMMSPHEDQNAKCVFHVNTPFVEEFLHKILTS